jgi:HSP20 family protein
VDLVPWSPLGGLSDARRLFERFLDDPWRLAGGALGAQLPPVEVFERDGEVVVRAELAGIDPQDMDVRIEEDAVTIRGERRAEERRQRGGYFHSERQYGTFVRTVALPAPVDTSRAEARFRHGLLEIHAPRHADDPRHGRHVDIQVQ